MKKTLAFIALALAAAPAFADVPNACEIIKVEEINTSGHYTAKPLTPERVNALAVDGSTHPV